MKLPWKKSPKGKTVVYDWTDRKHCTKARSYKAKDGRTRWTCTHEEAA